MSGTGAFNSGLSAPHQRAPYPTAIELCRAHGATMLAIEQMPHEISPIFDAAPAGIGLNAVSRRYRALLPTASADITTKDGGIQLVTQWPSEAPILRCGVPRQLGPVTVAPRQPSPVTAQKGPAAPRSPCPSPSDPRKVLPRTCALTKDTQSLGCFVRCAGGLLAVLGVCTSRPSTS